MSGKVGILCTMINGFGRRGYYNSQEIGLGRALARMGAEVWIYKGVRRHEPAGLERLSEGVTIEYIPMRGMGAHGYLDCSRLDRGLCGLFCFGDQQIFLPHVYRFCRKNGIVFVPYVGTAHSLHANFKSRVMNTLFALGTLRIYQKHPAVAKTEAAKRELEALGAERVTVAPVGLDTAVLKQDFRDCDRMELRKKHGFSETDVVICNVSRLSPEKRPLELLDLFSSVRGKKPFKLIIVGDGALRDRLRETIAERGLEAEITVYPSVPYEEMWEIYVMSDYYVNLNKGEIFGMAVMEAVYYETSVAAIAAAGPSVTLRGMKGHRLCETDEEAAKWLTAPYPPAEELRDSAAELEAAFTWERCARVFLGIVGEQKGEFSNEKGMAETS